MAGRSPRKKAANLDISDVVVFLGGADLEMVTIRELASQVLPPANIRDMQLAWGARASAYDREIRHVMASGRTPVLVELIDDLSPEIDRARLLFIDHHGDAAGADKPSSLRQVFQLLRALDANSPLTWTRHFELVEANDIGHIQGLRRAGATDDEISVIRAQDRAAQGITSEIEQQSRIAIARRRTIGSLTLIETELSTSSAITDFLDPALGGPSYENLLVEMPGKLAFYGSGSVIHALKDVPGCWYGGALPERGFWGCHVDAGTIAELRNRIIAISTRAEPAEEA